MSAEKKAGFSPSIFCVNKNTDTMVSTPISEEKILAEKELNPKATKAMRIK